MATRQAAQFRIVAGAFSLRNRTTRRRPVVRSVSWVPVTELDDLPSVNDFITSPCQRLAAAIASAALVRDMAAFFAVVLFGSMLTLVFSLTDRIG